MTLARFELGANGRYAAEMKSVSKKHLKVFSKEMFGQKLTFLLIKIIN